jgi:NADH-quinone oxidoreductase subunit M
MTDTAFPFLSAMLALPLIGAVMTGFCRHERLAKYWALLFASLELCMTLIILCLFKADQGEQFQLVERHTWIPSMHIDYLLGIDGLAVLFLPLSALLTLLAMGAGWNSTTHLPRLYFALLLVLESVTLGIFTALDMALFFLFWELTLPPLYFLISLWGIGAHRRTAALKYTLFMLFGGVPLIFAILLLAMNTPTGNSDALVLSLPELLKAPPPETLQPLVLLLLVLGFGVKAPLAPLHTWLPTVALEGPAQITALLTGLKLGIFGLLRFALPLAPAAAVDYSGLLRIVGVATLLYGALIALHQTNLRRLLAFLSISHVGLMVTGLTSFTLQGIQGALLQLMNFTIVASALMLIAGFIQQRLGSNEAVHLGGLAKAMPRLTCAYFLFALASIGLPGSSGFPAELLLILSALLSSPALGLAALIGAVLGAAALFSFTRRTFFGPVVHNPVAQAQDLRPRELALLCVPAVLVIGIGLYPQGVFNVTQKAAEAWLARFQPMLQQHGNGQ